MNTKRFLLAWLVVFAFVFLFEMAFHGTIMKGMYQQTASMWRNEADMKSLYHWIVIGQFLLAGVFCYIFTKGYEGKGTVEGIRYGLLIGILFAPQNLMLYAVAPYPVMMIVRWIGGGLMEAILAGVIVGIVYRPAKTA